MGKTLPFPQGKRFAFAVIDDTDVATVANVAPVYALLEQLGLCATKTVWPVACPEGSAAFHQSQTLEDADYLAFARDLQRRGFELTWHGATMESSRRPRTLRALDRFREAFGHYPRIHVSHSANLENPYWGIGRLDNPLLRRLLWWKHPIHFGGHVEGSEYWWGDRCAEHIRYGRNLTFDELNLLRVNPTLPYRDPRRPLVRYWFSAADAEDADEFITLLAPERLDRLQGEGGVCIVATHFGKGFARDGEVEPAVRERLEDLARRPGWFVNTGELLDWLRQNGSGGTLPRSEWNHMQWRWARDLVIRKWRARQRKRQGGKDAARHHRTTPGDLSGGPSGGAGT